VETTKEKRKEGSIAKLEVGLVRLYKARARVQVKNFPGCTQ